MNVGQAAPYVEAFSVARAAASTIYNIIDRVPNIDSSSSEGKKPADGASNIRFRDVHFNYPSRKDVKVCVLSHAVIEVTVLVGLNLLCPLIHRSYKGCPSR